MTINDLLVTKELNVYRMSKISGIPKTTLFDIVSGKADLKDCTGRNLLKIAKYLNITIEDLLNLDREIYISAYEENLPPFLKSGISKLKKYRNQDVSLIDCYYDELNSSINVCEVENLISHDHAEYLRNKYLYEGEM